MNPPVVFSQAINIYSVLYFFSYFNSPNLLIMIRVLFWTTNFPLSLVMMYLHTYCNICVSHYHSYIEGKCNYSSLLCYSSKYTTKDQISFSAPLHVYTYWICCLWSAGVDINSLFSVIFYLFFFLWSIFQVDPYLRCNLSSRWAWCFTLHIRL